MKCLKIQENMSLFYDGEMADKEKKDFLDHLGICDNCRNEYQYFKTAILALNGLNPIEPPADILAKVEEKIDKFERKKGFFKNFFNYPAVRLAPQLITVFLIIFVAGAGYYSYSKLLKLNREKNEFLKQKSLTKESQPFDRIASLDRKSLQDIDIAKVIEEKRSPRPLGKIGKRRKLLKKAKPALVASNAKPKNDIEVIPCDKNPKMMNEKIERLVVLSNGQIVKISGPQEANREVLIRVPGNAYGAFIERLKEAMAQANENSDKSRDVAPYGVRAKTMPMLGGETSQEVSAEAPNVSLKTGENIESELEATPIPEVKLIKVIYR